MLRSLALQLVMIGLFVAGCDLTGPCVNSQTIDVPSPDGRLTAWVFVRGCGATTADSIQVSLLPVEDGPPQDSGNTFIIEQDSTVIAEWPELGQLLISYEPRGEVFKQETQVAGVSIAYRPR